MDDAYGTRQSRRCRRHRAVAHDRLRPMKFARTDNLNAPTLAFPAGALASDETADDSNQRLAVADAARLARHEPCDVPLPIAWLFISSPRPPPGIRRTLARLISKYAPENERHRGPSPISTKSIAFTASPGGLGLLTGKLAISR